MTRPLTTRRGLAALFSGAAAAAALAPAARAALPPDQRQDVIRRLEVYLNGIRTLQARFSQVNPDGTASTGRVWLDRERQAMLFDYDAPAKIRLIAPGDWRVIFLDGTIRQVNVLPVAETPLGFLLAKQIRIGGDVVIADLELDRGEILMSVTRAKAADQGHVLLAFIERPIELRRWAVTDPQGLTTVVILEDMQLNKPISADLFTYRDPQIFGWPREW